MQDEGNFCQEEIGMKRIMTALLLTAMLASTVTGCVVKETDGTTTTQNRYKVSDTILPNNKTVYDGAVRDGMIYDGAARNGMVYDGTTNNAVNRGVYNAGNRAAVATR